MAQTITKQAVFDNAIGDNLRRLMAREKMTANDVSEASGVDLRTIRSVLRCRRETRAITLNKLARGLDVDPAEFFYDVKSGAAFDWDTNLILREYVTEHPELFHGWSQSNLDDLASRFAAGGQLTEEGILAVVALINRRQEVQRRVAVIMETADRELLEVLVRALYDRACIAGDEPPRAAAS